MRRVVRRRDLDFYNQVESWSSRTFTALGQGLPIFIGLGWLQSLAFTVPAHPRVSSRKEEIPSRLSDGGQEQVNAKELQQPSPMKIGSP